MKILTIVFFCFLMGCGASPKKESLNIAVSANMQFAMDSIVSVFESNNNIQCNLTFGSSGMLTAQIENGAPYDLFFAANMAYPDYLFAKNLGEAPKNYAQGRLVLVVIKDANYQNIDAVLDDPLIKRIGIADKRTAPYGIAAHQFLNNTNKIEALKTKLVISESISQVNQYISTNSVDAAFTAYSYLIQSDNDYKYFKVDAQYFDTINQGLMVLNRGRENHPSTIDSFLEFISSKECQAILTHFGYLAE